MLHIEKLLQFDGAARIMQRIPNTYVYVISQLSTQPKSCDIETGMVESFMCASSNGYISAVEVSSHSQTQFSLRF